MSIAETLREIQKRDGLTDVEMAKKIGQHPISWSRVKNGRSPTHDYDFLTNAARAYPVEMGPVIVRELLGENYRAVVKAMLPDILIDIKDEGR
jgi:transcriptional regulator with XRE-family HTH domain